MQFSHSPPILALVSLVVFVGSVTSASADLVFTIDRLSPTEATISGSGTLDSSESPGNQQRFFSLGPNVVSGTGSSLFDLSGNTLSLGSEELIQFTYDSTTNFFGLGFDGAVSVSDVLSGSVSAMITNGTWGAAGASGLVRWGTNQVEVGTWSVVENAPPPPVELFVTVERLSDQQARISASGPIGMFDGTNAGPRFFLVGDALTTDMALNASPLATLDENQLIAGGQSIDRIDGGSGDPSIRWANTPADDGVASGSVLATLASMNTWGAIGNGGDVIWGQTRIGGWAITDAVAVPEPSSLALTTLAIGGLLWRRRARV